MADSPFHPEHQRTLSSRVVLDIDEIRVDANPLIIANVVQNLVNNPEYRELFAEDPVASLAEIGVHVPPGVQGKLTKANIEATLDSLRERFTEDNNTAFAPGVAVGVRVGTSPGVRAGVQVGVESAVVTAVVSRKPGGNLRGGLKKRR